MAPLKAQQDEIKWALGALNARVGEYSRRDLFKLYADYYEGRHSLAFATKKFLETFGTTFRANVENLCRLPVDVLSDLMQVQGFAVANGETKTIATDAQEIWRRNRMEERAGQVHKNTALFSESYVIVWPDSDGKAVIYPNLPGNVAVQYHAEKLGFIIKAAKMWDCDGYRRLTIYTPDNITRYRTRNKGTGAAYGAFELYGTDEIPAVQPNPYGKVPVFRFVNNAAIGSAGESELRDVIPVQDRLNKALCDLLLASEYHAYPQRYALGYEVKHDASGKPINPFASGADRMWINENADGAFGQLSPGDLENYLKQLDDARMSIARISGVPPHYFGMDKGGWPSGESLKTASGRLTQKAIDRQISGGSSWADLMRFCLEVEGKKDVEVETIWKDPTPRLSVLESWQAAQAEQQAGGSKEKTLRERGYTQPEIDAAKADAHRAAFGDGFPPRSADDAEVAANDVSLNGAQITAALGIMQQLATGAIEEFAGTELLVAVGIARDKAAQMAKEALNNPEAVNAGVIITETNETSPTNAS
jgi:hypothetical protein